MGRRVKMFKYIIVALTIANLVKNSEGACQNPGIAFYDEDNGCECLLNASNVNQNCKSKDDYNMDTCMCNSLDRCDVSRTLQDNSNPDIWADSDYRHNQDGSCECDPMTDASGDRCDTCASHNLHYCKNQPNCCNNQEECIGLSLYTDLSNSCECPDLNANSCKHGGTWNTDKCECKCSTDNFFGNNETAGDYTCNTCFKPNSGAFFGNWSELECRYKRSDCQHGNEANRDGVCQCTNDFWYKDGRSGPCTHCDEHHSCKDGGCLGKWINTTNDCTCDISEIVECEGLKYVNKCGQCVHNTAVIIVIVIVSLFVVGVIVTVIVFHCKNKEHVELKEEDESVNEDEESVNESGVEEK